MSERRLYTTVTGDGGGVKTRVDVTQCATEVRFTKDGLNVLGATVRVEFPLGAEKPVVTIDLHDAVLGEVNHA